MKSWINKQVEINTSRFEKTMDDIYPETKIYSKDAKLFIDHIKKETNYFEAVNMINWDQYIIKSSQLLDLGCGIGWVSAYLSKLKNVQSITCVDSSQYYINKMLPQVFKYMKGKIGKIKSVEGVFYPILLDNNSLDGVIISASLHHSDNMEKLLGEVYRILKKDGYLFILNEDPRSNLRYIAMSIKYMLRVLYYICIKKYNPTNQSMGFSNILTDPDLGDRAYPEWALKEMLKVSGFNKIMKIDSGFSHSKTLKPWKYNSNLIHFICKK